MNAAAESVVINVREDYMSRQKREVAAHLEKARESAFLAVETYNRPRTSFRSGGYIVLMCIAWTALFHAIFFSRGVKPFYRRKSHRRHFEILDGDKKAWELSTCLAEFWGSNHPSIRLNLEFFIKLRNKIEHRSMPALDLDIFGECQALLFNFEDLLTSEFGKRFALNESLSLALQFSCHRNEQQEMAVRKLHKTLARDILSYIQAFRTGLSDDVRADLTYSYKVFLLPKLANHQARSDLAVEFVKYDPSNPEEMARISQAVALLKPTAPQQQPLSPIATLAASGTPIRITNDPTALAVRAVTYDDSHPYRQIDLLRRISALIPGNIRVTTHDLLAVRFTHNILENRDYFYKGRFGSGQYSEAYAQWLVQCIEGDPDFLSNARNVYRERSSA